jgi:hypothetical protein
MGLLYHRPIRYMVLHSFKMCKCFYFGVMKSVGRILMFLCFQFLELYGSLCLCYNEEVLNWR